MNFVDSLHLHPMLVHFPIAFFIGALLFQLAGMISKKKSLEEAAWVVFVAGSLMSVLAVASGLREAAVLHLKHPILDFHRTFAFTACGFGLLSALGLSKVRQRSPGLFRNIFIIVLLLTAGFVSAAAYQGGRMVYEYGIGMAQ